MDLFHYFKKETLILFFFCAHYENLKFIGEEDEFSFSNLQIMHDSQRQFEHERALTMLPRLVLTQAKFEFCQTRIHSVSLKINYILELSHEKNMASKYFI